MALEAILAGLYLSAGGLHAQGLELRFLDVGQGDAVFIRSNGRAALIDAGRSGAIVDILDVARADRRP